MVRCKLGKSYQFLHRFSCLRLLNIIQFFFFFDLLIDIEPYQRKHINKNNNKEKI